MSAARKINPITSYENETDNIAERVYFTRDYSKFKKIQGNRPVCPNNLKRLIEAMKYKDMKVPILVTEKFDVIDGQHRLEARKKLMLPVYYIITDAPADVDSIIVSTMAQKPLTTLSIAELRANTEETEYAKLLEFCKDYGLPITLGMRLTWKNCQKRDSHVRGGGGGGDHVLHNFKMGNYKCDNLAFAGEIGDLVLELFKETNSKVMKKTSFVFSLVNVYKMDGFDVEHFVNQVKSYKHKIENKATSRQFQDMIHEIYNYKTRAEKKMNLRAI